MVPLFDAEDYLLLEPEPRSDNEDCDISKSTSYLPSLPQSQIPQCTTDLIFLSSDAVLFFLHSHIVLRFSQATFGSLLSAPPSSQECQHRVVEVPETSDVLSILLHILYGTSCRMEETSFQTIVTAINQMPVYDMDPSSYIVVSSPMYALILAYAPMFPLELYALAAHLDWPGDS